MFIFGDFCGDWLTYSGGTDRPNELCYNFYISNDLTQMVNVATRVPECEKQGSKSSITTKKAIDRGKRCKTLSEVKLAENK